MRLLDWIDRASTAVGKIASFAIWFGMIFVCYEVVMRYAFNSPTVWVQGYMQRLFGAYFILVGAFALVQRGHVRVDLLLTNASPRRAAFLDVINYTALLIWMVALTFEAWLFFHDSWRFNERDETALGYTLWPIKLALLFGVIMMGLQGLAELLRALARLVNPRLARAQ